MSKGLTQIMGVLNVTPDSFYAGIACGAVAWGFATPEILRAQQPDHFFTSMQEIIRAVSVDA